MEHMEDKLTNKYVEALSEEYGAFFLYKHIWKLLPEKAAQTKILAIMEDEYHHYEAVMDMLFPAQSAHSEQHTNLEIAFKNELCRMKDEMKTCIEKLKKM